MTSEIKPSTIAGAAAAAGTVVAGASTAAAVVGGSAATIMSATAGTTGAALASLAGASGTAGAAAISSGMAAVGSVVGGGMAAGAIITAAVPVALAGALSIVFAGGLRTEEKTKGEMLEAAKPPKRTGMPFLKLKRDEVGESEIVKRFGVLKLVWLHRRHKGNQL